MSSVRPEAAVVIPTRDRPFDLILCLRALCAQKTTRRFEVIVVDDGTSPPLRGPDVAACPGVRLITSGGVGPGQARNRGLDAAAAPVILFTDDDTAPSPRWIDAACEFLDRHPHHVGVEGPTISPPFDPLYERSIHNERPGAYWTCNIAYRRDALLRLGGFAEVFPSAHGEDLDLGFRALELGPIGFTGEMVVVHYPVSVSVRDMVRRTRYVASDMVLYRRHPARFASRVPLPLRPVLGHVRYLHGTLRQERVAMIGTPRRFARFSLAAAGQLAVAVSTPLVGARREGG